MKDSRRKITIMMLKMPMKRVDDVNRKYINEHDDDDADDDVNDVNNHVNECVVC